MLTQWTLAIFVLIGGLHCSGSSADANDESQSAIGNPRANLDDDPSKMIRSSTVFISGGRGDCSGFLISPTRVVTARHCGEDSAFISIHFEESAADGVNPARARRPTRVRLHPSADVATLDVQSIGEASYRPIKIHGARAGSIVAGETVVIAGFGKTARDAGDGGELRWGKRVFQG